MSIIKRGEISETAEIQVVSGSTPKPISISQRIKDLIPCLMSDKIWASLTAKEIEEIAKEVEAMEQELKTLKEAKNN